MVNKYDLYVRPKTWRTIESAKGHTYIIPTDVLNIADHVHVDTHDPKSDGYGGRTLEFELENGEIYMAKGPWHSSGSVLLDVGLDVRDLHMTMLTLWSTKKEEVTHKGYITDEETGKLTWTDVTRTIDVKDEIIYEEKLPVLGMFMRGERVAAAYAKATGKTIYYRSESYGGASQQLITPEHKLHPMAERYE
jgi:hypothetical protein